MSRPLLLVFLLLVLIITSQFEWKQQLVMDLDPTQNVSQKQQQISKREEAVKEKIILLQEKNIMRLRELVQNLQDQLRYCKGSSDVINGTASTSTQNFMEIETQQILQD